MPPEFWLVLTVAAAFLLLGIAGSPLAWVLLHHRRSRLEQLMELRWGRLADQVRGLEDRLTQHESIRPVESEMPSVIPADAHGRRGPVAAGQPFGRVESGVRRPAPIMISGARGALRADFSHDSALIAVPNLEGTPTDRDVTVSGLKERYAAIWALADSGAAADVIARATGQPVGQIELILGLRRQIDGKRTISSHAPHE